MSQTQFPLDDGAQADAARAALWLFREKLGALKGSGASVRRALSGLDRPTPRGVDRYIGARSSTRIEDLFLQGPEFIKMSRWRRSDPEAFDKRYGWLRARKATVEFIESCMILVCLTDELQGWEDRVGEGNRVSAMQLEGGKFHSEIANQWFADTLTNYEPQLNEIGQGWRIDGETAEGMREEMRDWLERSGLKNEEQADELARMQMALEYTREDLRTSAGEPALRWVTATWKEVLSTPMKVDGVEASVATHIGVEGRGLSEAAEGAFCLSGNKASLKSNVSIGLV